MSEIIYETDGPLGRSKVQGLQIGRFAVRRKPNDAYALRGPNGDTFPCRDWLVDHINTGFTVLSVDTFDEAVIVADDVSRFSKRDVSARTPQKFVQQIGPEIHRWLAYISQRRNKVISFRRWRSEHGVATYFGQILYDETHHIRKRKQKGN